MANIKKVFGKNVRRRRRELNLSQEKLAEQCDLHRTYIGGIERGERNVGLENIQKIAKALGLKMRDLFDKE
jgi:transcriptional regulator with XRE-family HTH domain